MSEPLEELAKHLKANGYSLTTTRQQVFQALQNQEPLSMSELFIRCGTIDRATLYRVVALFETLGIVQRLAIGWKYKLELAGKFIHHHHHFTCTVCGSITPLPDDRKLEHQLTQLAASQDFTMVDHQLEIRGRCAACAR